MYALKVPQFLPNCTNEYAKKNEEKEKEEKEENITILTKCHGKLLTTMSDYIFNNTLAY